MDAEGDRGRRQETTRDGRGGMSQEADGRRRGGPKRWRNRRRTRDQGVVEEEARESCQKK